nr:ribonuclease H-like domain-containing protein [Tanacetum cinerariifolium]
MSPTKSFFDFVSRRISIFIVNTYVSVGCSGNTTRIMRKTLKILLVITIPSAVAGSWEHVPNLTILITSINRYELFAPCHVILCPKSRIHTRIEPLDLELLDSVSQCFQNPYQRAITELVDFIELHDLSFIVGDREHYCSKRLNDGIIMLELKRRNDVKVRTTLLLALPDEHQLRFSKYETAQELWGAILKTFGGNVATKKTKKYQLKQQYGNFKAEGSETLEQTFNRLQAIVSHLEFMDVEIKQDDLNQKFLTSLAPEWIIFSNGSQIKYKDITQIDEDDIKEMDIKWNMALLSMRADRFWKKTGKKITIQGTNVAGFDKSKVECFNCHKMGHFARECRAARSQDRGRRESYKQEENHALVADDEAPTEFALMAKSSSSLENEEVKELIRTRRVLDTVLFPPSAQVYSPPKKDISWTRLPEFADDTITDYSRPSPSIESNTSDFQNSNPSVSKHGESSNSIMSKLMIKFMKATNSLTVIKTNKVKTARKPSVKYAEMYRNTSKSPKVRGQFPE